MNFVYILWSEVAQRFYIGQTTDVQERLKRHSAGWEKATKPYKPWKLIWTAAKESKSEAVILERKLKNLSQARLVQFILKYSEGVAGPDEFLLMEKLSGC